MLRFVLLTYMSMMVLASSAALPCPGAIVRMPLKQVGVKKNQEGIKSTSKVILRAGQLSIIGEDKSQANFQFNENTKQWCEATEESPLVCKQDLESGRVVEIGDVFVRVAKDENYPRQNLEISRNRDFKSSEVIQIKTTVVGKTTAASSAVLLDKNRKFIAERSDNTEAKSNIIEGGRDENDEIDTIAGITRGLGISKPHTFSQSRTSYGCGGVENHDVETLRQQKTEAPPSLEDVVRDLKAGKRGS